MLMGLKFGFTNSNVNFVGVYWYYMLLHVVNKSETMREELIQERELEGLEMGEEERRREEGEMLRYPCD